MEKIRRYTFTFTRPSDATQYAAGDEISNSATAGSVVRGTVDLGFGVRKAKVVRAGIDITPASATLVITALDFSLIAMKASDTLLPAAVGDNVALNISGAARNKAAKFSFVNTAWTSPAGALTAGTSGFQEVVSAVSGAGSGAIPGNLFDFTQGDLLPTTVASTARTLTFMLQAIGAWNPGAVVNVFNIAVDIEIEE
jgi:hypothetical protein